MLSSCGCTPTPRAWRTTPAKATPNAPRAWTDSQGKAKVSDKNLAAKGFTKYVKSGDGTYEKAAGSGPKTFKRK